LMYSAWAAQRPGWLRFSGLVLLSVGPSDDMVGVVAKGCLLQDWIESRYWCLHQFTGV